MLISHYYASFAQPSGSGSRQDIWLSACMSSLCPPRGRSSLPGGCAGLRPCRWSSAGDGDRSRPFTDAPLRCQVELIPSTRRRRLRGANPRLARRNALEEKWRDNEIRYARRTGIHMDEQAALAMKWLALAHGRVGNPERCRLKRLGTRPASAKAEGTPQGAVTARL
jgi:hypothetical protein